MNWNEIKVTAHKKYLDDICAVMSMIDTGLMIEDYSDVSEGMNAVYGELLDESILNRDKNIISVSVYISEDKNYVEAKDYITMRLDELKIEGYCVDVITQNEEEWATAWKKYYKPSKISDSIVVVPSWEEYTPVGDEKIINLDPGMAFGTGTHETTRLCARLLEKYIKPGDEMLDVGTGSGILAVCGALLGASYIYAYDIDSMAVRVAQENADKNNIKNIHCGVSDLLKNVKKQKYGTITANIVADIIIRILPQIGEYLEDDGTFIASGIISQRLDEVREAAKCAGFEEVSALFDNDWCALAFEKRK